MTKTCLAVRHVAFEDLGLLGPLVATRGYGVRYGLMILSHRLLRYSAWALHLVALVANALLFGRGPTPPGPGEAGFVAPSPSTPR